jgi:hypothetical protein
MITKTFLKLKNKMAGGDYHSVLFSLIAPSGVAKVPQTVISHAGSTKTVTS